MIKVRDQGQIIVARVAVASVTKTAELFGVSRAAHIKDHDGIQEALKTLQQPDFQSYRRAVKSALGGCPEEGIPISKLK